MSYLYVIPTPIGNLKDITFRAIEILKEVDLILAEDTRTTSRLLKEYNILTKSSSYHLHNEHKITSKIVEKLLAEEKKYALVSDAGTPAISDPGFLLIRECVKQGIKVNFFPPDLSTEDGLPFLRLL